MAGCHLLHGTLRKQLQSQLTPHQGHSESYFTFPFFQFYCNMLFLVLRSDCCTQHLISQSPPTGQCRPVRKGMNQCLKAPVKSLKEPSIPTSAEYLHLYTFISKYGLNTLCVAPGPAPWQKSEWYQTQFWFCCAYNCTGEISHKCRKGWVTVGGSRGLTL